MIKTKNLQKKKHAHANSRLHNNTQFWKSRAPRATTKNITKEEEKGESCNL